MIAHKSEAISVFNEYKIKVENQLGRTMKVLGIDRGGEYTSNEFDEYCKKNSIQHQLTMAYTPQQNGVAKRCCSRTLMKMCRSMMANLSRSQNFWGEGISTAI